MNARYSIDRLKDGSAECRTQCPCFTTHCGESPPSTLSTLLPKSCKGSWAVRCEVLAVLFGSFLHWDFWIAKTKPSLSISGSPWHVCGQGQPSATGRGGGMVEQCGRCRNKPRALIDFFWVQVLFLGDTIRYLWWFSTAHTMLNGSFLAWYDFVIRKEIEMVGFQWFCHCFGCFPRSTACSAMLCSGPLQAWQDPPGALEREANREGVHQNLRGKWGPGGETSQLQARGLVQETALVFLVLRSRVSDLFWMLNCSLRCRKLSNYRCILRQTGSNFETILIHFTSFLEMIQF